MTEVKLALMAVALTFPLLSLSVAAQAATAHNLQTGARTKNPSDTKATANMKQMRMRRHSRHY